MNNSNTVVIFYFGKTFLFICFIFLSNGIFGQMIKKSEAPDFLSVVERYANAMIQEGRDNYGAEYSPLFASTLNRKTLKLPDKNDILEISGVRARDRSLTGANLIHDIDLLKILYAFDNLYNRNEYAEEANKALHYFLENCQSPSTGLFCWGEHLYWNFITDDCGYAPDYDFHEAKEWPFWDQFYQLVPEACWNFVIGEWDHQINDKATGDFSRHARYTEHGTDSGFDFPRYAGQMIERWANAYNRPENANRIRREELLTAIKVLFNRMQENMKLSESGYLIAGRSPKGDHNSVVWLTSNLELARCLEEAAPVMNPKLSNQMRKFALKQDMDFLNAPHKLDSVGGGFAVTLHAKTGLPRTRSMNKPYTSTWSSGYGYGTHAGTANTCYQRFESLKEEHIELACEYKKWILTAGEKYLTSHPDTSLLLKPNEFSDLIELMLNCYELTGRKDYMDRAVFFAQSATELFLKNDSPLPKATNKHNHYESITGGPSLMYQLLKLHYALTS